LPWLLLLLLPLVVAVVLILNHCLWQQLLLLMLLLRLRLTDELRPSVSSRVSSNTFSGESCKQKCNNRATVTTPTGTDSKELSATIFLMCCQLPVRYNW
jgi:hypothetical protein